MFSVNTQEDRTLFFDLLPINLGYIYGNSIHLQIYTVPGQVQYDASRRVVLGGADGVVFVADSSEAQMQENVDSLSNLYHNLNANRLNIKQIPFVIQYNKRDLAGRHAGGRDEPAPELPLRALLRIRGQPRRRRAGYLPGHHPRDGRHHLPEIPPGQEDQGLR